MIRSGDALTDQILMPFILWVFIVAGFAGVVLGLGLIARGGGTLRALGSLNRWISVRSSLKPMEEPHDIAAAVYGHRRWFGAVFAIGGAFIVFMLLVQVQTAAVAVGIAGARSVAVEWIVDSLKWLLVAGGALAAITGVLLVVSPNALHALEARVNRWYSPRKLGKGADTMHFTLDRWVEAHPRIAGTLLALGAAIVLFSSVVVWVRN